MNTHKLQQGDGLAAIQKELEALTILTDLVTARLDKARKSLDRLRGAAPLAEGTQQSAGES